MLSVAATASKLVVGSRTHGIWTLSSKGELLRQAQFVYTMNTFNRVGNRVWIRRVFPTS